MAVVFGFSVDDPRQAQTARTLMGTHLFIIAVGVFVGVLGIIGIAVLKSAVDDFAASTGNTYSADVRQGAQASVGGVNVGQLTLFVVLPMVCPLLACLMVRSGISGNNPGLLQCACCFDGCCACCTFLGGVSCIVGFITYSKGKTEVRQWDCTSHSSFCDSDLQMQAADGLGSAAVVSIISAVLCFVLCLSCTVATMKANTAHNSLRMGSVFTGTPPVPQMTSATVYGGQVYGAPAAGYSGPAAYGSPYATGHVVGSQVVGGQVIALPVVGQPVGAVVVQATVVSPTPVTGSTREVTENI